MTMTATTGTRRAANAENAPNFYTTGKLSRLLGISPRTVTRMMDRHTDLVYRINDDRRLHRSHLDKLLSREGITRQHLGLSPAAAFAWVGRPVEELLEVRDKVVTPVAAMALLHAGETDGLAAFLHDLSADDLRRMGEACTRAGVRFAAVLPDDAEPPARMRTGAVVWLFRRDGGTDERAVMRWVRGVE